MTEIGDSVLEGIWKLGYGQLPPLACEQKQGHSLARVVAVHKDRFTIAKDHSDVLAELSGKFIYQTDSALDMPAVGDWVLVDFYDDDTHAIIHELVPRKSLLKRKSAGKNIDYQLIAANIDVAFVIQSFGENFNLRRLERYLVMIHESGIKPVVLFSKSDLISSEEVKAKLASIADLVVGLDVIAFSNESGARLSEIKALLEPRWIEAVSGYDKHFSDYVGQEVRIRRDAGAARGMKWLRGLRACKRLLSGSDNNGYLISTSNTIAAVVAP